MRKLVSVVALACSFALMPLAAGAELPANPQAGTNPCIGVILTNQGYTPAEAVEVYPEYFSSVQHYLQLQQNCRIYNG